MTKIDYLRKNLAEKYNEHDFFSAVQIGEVLLREHWHNKNMWTKEYADDLFNLARAYEELGEYNRSAELFSDSARQISETEGNGLDFAERLSGLGRVLIRLGAYEPAFGMLKDAKDIRRNELGEAHALYADSLYNCAIAACEMGKPDAALSFHAQALHIRQRINAPAEDIVNSLHSMAFIHKNANEYEEALTLYEEAYRLSSAISGKNHVIYMSCLREMSAIHNELGNIAQAEEFILESIKIRRIFKDEEEATHDIMFLVRLYLQYHDTVRACEALVYALQCCALGDSKLFQKLHLDILMELQEPLRSEFLEELAVLSDMGRLAEIVAKWVEWEGV
ncbi:MAG: tetratricopeptide repeat protein [Defluviitaleaceae bacterium]|nr:tetratricopeptide repeat protein [Defluviitaleaceae bacterium]